MEKNVVIKLMKNISDIDSDTHFKDLNTHIDLDTHIDSDTHIDLDTHIYSNTLIDSDTDVTTKTLLNDPDRLHK